MSTVKAHAAQDSAEAAYSAKLAKWVCSQPLAAGMLPRISNILRVCAKDV